MGIVLNYTTKVEVTKSVAEIEALLVKHGASGVMKRFDPQTRRITGLTFEVHTPGGTHSFELPVRTEPIFKKLWGQRKRIPYVQRQVDAMKRADLEQAERVAWRVAKDWLEVQLTLVSLGMTTLSEVMLPYMLAGDGVTVFEAYRRQMALPAPE
jgi:hypothetical protein